MRDTASCAEDGTVECFGKCVVGQDEVDGCPLPDGCRVTWYRDDDETRL